MSRRRLSEDERTLWKGVTRSIAPLRKKPARDADDPAPPSPAPASKPWTRAKASLVAPPAPPPAKPMAPPPLSPLGRRTRQRIARGRDALDGRLDLHGLTQAEAHDALFGFLRTRQGRGARMVLIITGKGAGDGSGGRGVLKRMVPLWLRLPEFRELIVGFESASTRHGGEGALYVHMRRPRSSD